MLVRTMTSTERTYVLLKYSFLRRNLPPPFFNLKAAVMNKVLKLLLFISLPFAVQCQSPISIEGLFKEKIDASDSVVFVSSGLNSSYYEQDFLKAPITN